MVRVGQLIDERIVDGMGDAITIVERDGTIRSTTSENRHTPISPTGDDWPGRDTIGLLADGDQQRANELLAAFLSGSLERASGEARAVTAAGDIQIIQFEAFSYLDDPEIDGIVLVTRDITCQQRCGDMLDLHAEALDSLSSRAGDEVLLGRVAAATARHVAGAQVAVVSVGPDRVLSLDGHAGLHDDLHRLLDGLPLAPDLGVMDAAILDHEWLLVEDVAAEPGLGEFRHRLVDAGVHALVVGTIDGAPGVGPTGAVVALLDQRRGPTDSEMTALRHSLDVLRAALGRRETEAFLSDEARRDPLTGLANRSEVQRRLDGLLGDQGGPTAAAFIDIDHLQIVNDGLGHSTGDDLLRSFGRRLDAELGSVGLVGRFAADQFLVAMHDCDAAGAEAIVSSVLRTIEDLAFFVDGHELFVGASAGIAISDSGSSDSAEELIARADAALHAAKAAGRGTIRVFDSEMHRPTEERLGQEADLRRALDRGDFVPVYQPIVDAHTGVPTGAEVLARRRGEADDLVPPSSFLLAAEEQGLIGRLGEQVIERALADAATWRRNGVVGSDFRLSVNLSARQLTEDGMVERLADLLSESGFPAEDLALEITETAMLSDSDRNLQILGEVKALGVQLAIDDFGTGYSSLGYLHRFPIDFVKIDRSFAVDLGNGSDDGATIVAAVVQIARTLGLSTVMEGIETHRQRDAAEALGCDRIQGFLVSRGVPAPEFEELVRGVTGSLIPPVTA